MMQLAITQNPHIENADDRRALWDRLEAMMEDEEYTEEEPIFDRAGMERLKLAISDNPRIIVKK